MSSFAGCYHFDGKPVDRDATWAMGQALGHEGHDAARDYCHGPLGMSYRAFHTTRESHFEGQPMEAHSGAVLCWDGRLDNREELQPQLDCSPVPTDAELVIAAYEKWGEAFLAHLMGDFALAMFDPRNRQILLARDFFGPRPLFYVLQAETLFWSTGLRPLLQHAQVDPALDDDYIAQFLVLAIEPHRSPYRNIHSVEPGHVIVFRDGRVSRNAWHWKPDPAKRICLKTDREYEETFNDLFRQSVKSRLRSDCPVWGDLSGGLDSSSVVCVADDSLSHDFSSCPRLDTWTAVNGDSILTNELPYVRLVEEKRGRTGYHLHDDDLWFQDILLDEYQQMSPHVTLCAPVRTARLNQAMNDAGARVRLSGHAGDHLLASSGVSSEPADLLRSLRLRSLHEQLKTWSQANKQPYLQTVWQHALLPALPRPLRERFETCSLLLDSLPQSFRRRSSISTFVAYPRDPFGYKLPSQRERVRRILGAARITAAGMNPEFATHEVRYPFLDRRLVEWLLAIPTFQIQRPGETRSLMRRALQHLLPTPIWQRRTKGTFDEGVCRGVNAGWSEVERLLSESRLARLGYFEPKYLQEASRSVAHGGTMTRVVFIRLIALELWLRAIDRRQFRSSVFNRRSGARTPVRGIPKISFAKD